MKCVAKLNPAKGVKVMMINILCIYHKLVAMYVLNSLRIVLERIILVLLTLEAYCNKKYIYIYILSVLPICLLCSFISVFELPFWIRFYLIYYFNSGPFLSLCEIEIYLNHFF